MQKIIQLVSYISRTTCDCSTEAAEVVQQCFTAEQLFPVLKGPEVLVKQLQQCTACPDFIAVSAAACKSSIYSVAAEFRRQEQYVPLLVDTLFVELGLKLKTGQRLSSKYIRSHDIPAKFFASAGGCLRRALALCAAEEHASAHPVFGAEIETVNTWWKGLSAGNQLKANKSAASSLCNAFSAVVKARQRELQLSDDDMAAVNSNRRGRGDKRAAPVSGTSTEEAETNAVTEGEMDTEVQLGASVALAAEKRSNELRRRRRITAARVSFGV